MSNEAPTDALRLVPSMPTVELTDDMLFKIETGETVTWGELKRRQYEKAVRNFNTMREDGSLSAPASPLPGGGWQDISTLPQKGAFTPLVDVWATGPGKDSDVSHYRITDCWRGADGVWFSMTIGELKQSRVTHWMPLPAAPTGDA